MFKSILRLQWKSSKGIVLLAALATFAMPLASLVLSGATARITDANAVISTMASMGMVYAIAAAGMGLLLAIAAWSPDHRGRHIYALTLPIERWRYVLLKLGAGAVLLVPPAITLAISGEIVAHSGAVPQGLHAYPMALVCRFLLAAAVAYSLFFAITAATPRTAGIIVGLVGALVVLQLVIASAVVSDAPRLQQFLVPFVFMPARDALFAAPGLLAAFTGRWMLIDV